MKPAICCAVALACCSIDAITGLAQSREPKLTGIVYWDGQRFALLELPSPSGVMVRLILEEGEASSGFNVREIRETAVVLEVRATKELRTLELPSEPGEPIQGRGLRLHDADLRQVLEIYQMFSGRTVIAPAELKISRVTLKSGAKLNTAPALAALEKALADAGLTLKPVGTKFVFALDEPTKQRIGNLRKPPAEESALHKMWGSFLQLLGFPRAKGTFPPGLVKFTEADCSQVLDVYRQLSGCSVTNTVRLPAGKVTVRSQTPLTQLEATWLLEATLATAGVKIVPDGQKRVIAAPTDPRRNPNVAVSTPDFSFTITGPEQLLAMYADAVGRKPLPISRPVAEKRVKIRMSREAAKDGAFLRRLAESNGLKFVEEGQEDVKLILFYPP